MTSSRKEDLKVLMSASAVLSGSDSAQKIKIPSMFSVLHDRLIKFHQVLGSLSPYASESGVIDRERVPDLNRQIVDQVTAEKETADMSLWAVIQIHNLTIEARDTEGINTKINPLTNEAPPDLGTRDIAFLRTLLAIVFKWNVEQAADLILEHQLAVSDVPRKPGQRAPPLSQAKITDIASDASINDTRENLRQNIDKLLGLVFPSRGTDECSIFQSHIAKIILTRHITALLRGCIALACEKGSDRAMVDEIDRLLKILPTTQSITSLGFIMASSAVVRPMCGSLLSQMILKPGGVRGLLGAVFGENTLDEAAPLAKFEHVARVLSAVPQQNSREDYYENIIPRILSILSPSHVHVSDTPAPETHKRAASFAIMRMLTIQPELTSSVLSKLLHQPFYPPESSEASSNNSSVALSLERIQSLLSHADPSPLFPHHLITPIITPLYALLARLDRQRTADPTLRELVRGLVRTWGGTVDADEAVQGWWDVVRGGKGWGDRSDVDWEVVGDEAKVVVGLPVDQTFGLLQSDSPDGDIGNPLELFPEPSHLVSLWKSIERKDVISALLVRALNEYQVLQSNSTSDPLRTMLHLKLVMEMVEQLGSTALTQPQHILSFIAHAIDPSNTPGPKKKEKADQKGSAGLRLDDLRIVETDSDDEGDPLRLEDDSDDEDGPEDLTSTAVNLLLAVLEADESLTPLNTTLLQVILSHLAPLTLHTSESIRMVSREARLVLTARSASSSSSKSAVSTPANDQRTAALEKYQQALKLLQDPILPVRAHGLLILRQLVVPSSYDTTAIKDIDTALIPAILDIFLQSVQEDDSYIFLNAVQGLVAMVNVLGHDILKGLVEVYAGGLLGGAPQQMSKAELDKRVRVGEALGQSVKKLGNALGRYVDALISPLFKLVRSRDVPTTLRTSALSLLAQCVETSPSAVGPWLTDLASGVLDLVQLEGVSSKPLDMERMEKKADGITLSEKEGDTDPPSAKGRREDVMDHKPLSKDPKMAPFRRAALHFLSRLLHSSLQQNTLSQPSHVKTSLESSTFNFPSRSYGMQRDRLDDVFPEELVRKMRIVLSYAKAYDEDDVVRVMARETLELVNQLDMARSVV